MFRRSWSTRFRARLSITRIAVPDEIPIIRSGPSVPRLFVRVFPARRLARIPKSAGECPTSTPSCRIADPWIPSRIREKPTCYKRCRDRRNGEKSFRRRRRRRLSGKVTFRVKMGKIKRPASEISRAGISRRKK